MLISVVSKKDAQLLLEMQSVGFGAKYLSMILGLAITLLNSVWI